MRPRHAPRTTSMCAVLCAAGLAATALAGDPETPLSLIFDFGLPDHYVDENIPDPPIPPGILWATRTVILGQTSPCDCPDMAYDVGIDHLQGIFPPSGSGQPLPEADLGDGRPRPVEALNLAWDVNSPYRLPVCGYRKWCPTLVNLLEGLDDHGITLDFVIMDYEHQNGDDAYRENLVATMQLLSGWCGSGTSELERMGNYQFYPTWDGENGLYMPDWANIGMAPFGETPGFEVELYRMFNQNRRAHIYRHVTELNVANPVSYFTTTHAFHASAAWGAVNDAGYSFSYQAPSVKAAIYWAPLEEASLAKRCLPPGDLLLPYVAPFVGAGCRQTNSGCGPFPGWCCDPEDSGCGDTPGPEQPVPYYYNGAIGHPWRPSRRDNEALIQHLRLRGADGVVMFHDCPAIDNNNNDLAGNQCCGNAGIDERAADSNTYRKWVTDAWRRLDPYFENGVRYLNLRTSKRTGVQWSGVAYETSPGSYSARVLVSNMGDRAITMSALPSGEEWDWFNWPDEFAAVTATVNPGAHASFNIALPGWDPEVDYTPPSPADTYAPAGFSIDDMRALQDQDPQYPFSVPEGWWGRCMVNGGCVEMLEDDCETAGGNFIGIREAVELANGVLAQIVFTCDELMLGACCTTQGCIETTAIDCCEEEGGNFIGQGDCLGECLGACCLSASSCSEETAEDCDVMGGEFLGPGVECAPSGGCPLGACCLEGEDEEGMIDYACEQFLVNDCLASGGVFKGWGILCSVQAVCETVWVACCLDGDCIDAPESACDQLGGLSAPDTSCAHPQVKCPGPSGACCQADGSCIDMTENDCQKIPGTTWGGEGTLCDAGPLVGACCLPDTSCIEMTEGDCQKIPGSEWGGPSTSCDCPCGR